MKNSERKPIQSKKLIYVEGNDERNLFEQLIEDLGVDHSFDVRNYRGQDKLKNDLPTLIDTDGFHQLEGLIITQDADNSPDDTFDSVKNIVDTCGLPVPDAPFTIESGDPSVSIFIFPDGERKGSVETICVESVVDQKEDVFSCVDDFLSCLENSEDGLPGKKEKARAHSYLVSTSDPESSVGFSAKQGHWNLSHDAFSDIRDIVQRI